LARRTRAASLREREQNHESPSTTPGLHVVGDGNAAMRRVADRRAARMTQRRHPGPDILAAYAAGVLARGFELVVEAHVETCSRCCASAKALETISGAALEQMRPTDVAPGALARVLARLDDAPVCSPPPRARPLLERLPLKPRKVIMPGVWIAAVDIRRPPKNRVYVLSAGPGKPAARHGHAGAEFCAVLKGAYRDESGVFRAGDFAAAERNVDHKPVAGIEGCVCLIATEGRLKARGPFGRAAFAYAGI
jgi:putative transcriptional regulator